MTKLGEGYREDLDPAWKARLDTIDELYGEDLADAVHEALLFVVGAVDPDDPSDGVEGGTRLQDFVRAAMFAMDIDWLQDEVDKRRNA